jgi:hypothetical protein
MKQLTQALFLSAVIGITGYFVFQNINKSEQLAMTQLPAESALASEQLPPMSTSENQLAVVNKQRLATLAGQPYNGPSYKEDYSKLEMMVADKQKNKDRLPANESATNQPQQK